VPGGRLAGAPGLADRRRRPAHDDAMEPSRRAGVCTHGGGSGSGHDEGAGDLPHAPIVVAARKVRGRRAGTVTSVDVVTLGR